MRDVLPEISRWLEKGQPVALATVIQTWGSSPRQAGAKMAMTAGNQIAGSVSGGCIEGAVYEAGMETLETRTPRLLHFGVADETAWEVGLACGGSVDVFVKPLDPAFFNALKAEYAAERRFAVVSVVAGPADLLGREMVVHDDGATFGNLGELKGAALAAARSAMEVDQTRRVRLSDAIEVFIEVNSPPPTLIVVGGVHIAITLASLAKTLGYRTIIVDPRKAFGTETRFPHVDRLIQKWPDEALEEIGLNRTTAVAMLTHDPKLDDPALKIALPSPAFYVGALGSQKTQVKRRERLLAEGLTQAQLDRLHGPIGLDLGATSPEEIALSVMAEIVAIKNKA